MSIAAGLAAGKEPARFQAGPASSYPAHQTNEKVTVAADVFDTEEKAKTAFGKNNPYPYGVLPILVVIQNDSGKALRLDDMKVEYVVPGREKVGATPAGEVRYLKGPSRPDVIQGPTKPTVLKKKNPLGAWEIEGRAFAARMIPPGESASGFVYFHTGFRRSSSLYLTGIKEAGTGRELFYFEIPLAAADAAQRQP